jgi:hypothetical protein
VGGGGGGGGGRVARGAVGDWTERLRRAVAAKGREHAEELGRVEEDVAALLRAVVAHRDALEGLLPARCRQLGRPVALSLGFGVEQARAALEEGVRMVRRLQELEDEARRDLAGEHELARLEAVRQAVMESDRCWAATVAEEVEKAQAAQQALGEERVARAVEEASARAARLEEDWAQALARAEEKVRGPGMDDFRILLTVWCAGVLVGGRGGRRWSARGRRRRRGWGPSCPGRRVSSAR